MSKILSTPTVLKDFPAGTTEEQFQFLVVGTAFNQTFPSATPSLTLDATQLPPGSYQYQVSKNGETCIESDFFTVSPAVTTVSFSVPDATQKAPVPTDA